jgi:dTDP-glucose 4,6-dehydratase
MEEGATEKERGHMAGERRIAVIGSNSFSGSDFIDLLLEDERNRVLGVSRSPEKSALFLPYKKRPKPAIHFHQMDLNRHLQDLIALLDDYQPEAIVNFATQSEVAPSWEHPEQWFQTNAVAIAELTSTLRTRKYLRRYLHISSTEVYGSCHGDVTETAPLNPSTPYAASRAAADLYLITLWKNFQFPLLIARATNVYGAHQQLHKIMPRTIIYLKQGRTIELHGGGAAIKSYIHIRDVSRGYLAILDKGTPGSIYHLSPDRGHTVRDVVGLICDRLGHDLSTVTRDVAERLGQDAAYVTSSRRSRQELGWKPQITLADGIDDVVRWVNDNWDEILTLPLEYHHKP